MKPFNSILKGLVQVLGLMAVLGAASVALAETQNSITALGVSSAGNGATVVKVEFAQPLTGLPRDFTINTPPRIALDFPNTTNGLGKSVQSLGEGELRSANIVQAGTRTRW
jgi:type IV pilus assembly protein PilQ